MSESSTYINGLCRCCHARGKFKSLGVPYVVEDREEIYGVMIRETLGILISPQPGEDSASTYTICESCIVSLQDAARFKRQVLACEDDLSKMFVENIVVKVEYCDEDVKTDHDSEPSEKGAASNSSTSKETEYATDVHGFEVEIKIEENKKHKAKGPSSPRSKGKMKREEAEGSDSDTEWAVPLNYIQEDPPENPVIDVRDVPCTICDKKFTHAGLRKHMNFHNFPRVRVHTCHICQNNFTGGREVIEHIRVAHVVDESYPCNVCSENFDTPELLKRHLTDHYNNELVKCNDCGREYKRHRLPEHVRTHTERFSCEMCGKRYVSKQSLVVHLRTHENKKPYVCDICGKCFTLARIVRMHVLRVHSGVKAYECKFCHKGFSTKYSRDAHETRHTGMKPFSCDVCKKTFAVNAALVAHMMTHNEDKPYICGICGKRFKQPICLKIHEKWHTGKKDYICDICQKPFHQKQNLKSHMRVHTGEKAYSCVICNAKLASTKTLKGHMRTHSGEKYTCKICNKQISDLRQHMRRHRRGMN